MQNTSEQEQKALVISIIGTLFMAGLGIGFSLLTASNAILLDGLFSLIGFIAGLMALRVSRLVQQPDDDHYQFGYGSFEAFFNLLKGITIAIISIFAFTDAVNALLGGGRPIQAGYALFYTVLAGAGCLLVSLYLRSAARKTGSPLLQLDARSWTIDGLLTLAVLIAFSLTIFIEKTEYAWAAVYADPAIVATLVILVLPLPYTAIRDNARQLLLSSPDKQLQSRVHELLQPELEKIDKQDYLVRMTEVGRFFYMQIYLQLSPQSENIDVAAQDVIRRDIYEKLAGELPNVSVDIIFTREKKWFGNIV
jgi:cation diffusion facilitator family transporter